jgi:SAM-dependent methyltransferase
MDLKESELLGATAARHWYYSSKAAAMKRFIEDLRPSRILDVGAGSGFFTRHLLEQGVGRSAICVDTGYPEDRDETFAGKPLAFRRQIDADAADLGLFMDVLEHVDDDAALLASYAQKLPASASFLITVPAHQWLWSDHDVFLEHRRRYGIGQLESTVKNAGLRVDRSSYFFGFVLPIAAAARLAARLSPARAAQPRSQLQRHGALTNAVLAGLCRAEMPTLGINRLAGLSVFCLASKAP